MKNFGKDKIFLKLIIERCRELHDTKILFDSTKNIFVQSVFIEIMLLLRHLAYVLEDDSVDDSVIKIRDAGAHPYLNREIKESNIFVDFGRNYIGAWELKDGVLKAKNDNCDVQFQYGDYKISAKDILNLIEKYEVAIKELDRA